MAPFYQLDEKCGEEKTKSTLSKIPFVFPQAAEFHSGGAGLYSPVGDYLLFLRMLLNEGSLDGQNILRPETVGLMLGDGGRGPEVRTLKGCGDSLDLRFHDGVRKRWGLCFMVNEEELPSGRSKGSQFWGGAANTYVWIDPQKEIAGVFATQMLPFQNKLCEDAFYRFENTIYGEWKK